MKGHLYLFCAGVICTALAIPGEVSAQQSSDGWYRIPYNNNTRVKVTRDHTNHFSNGVLTTRIDMIGTGGGDYAIVAAADGVVRRIVDTFDERLDSGPGVTCFNNYVWIEHANGEWTKYTHFKKNSVRGAPTFGAGLKEGDTVSAGRFLGWESDVGCASGDHLHFEVAELGTSPSISAIGGFINGSLNRIPRVCAAPGGRFRKDTTYTSVGFGIPVYKDKNFDGDARAFAGNIQNYPDLHELGFGDNISSIMSACPDPLYAVFYEHGNFGGRALYYNGTSIGDTHEIGFGNNISSMRVYKTPQTGITIYEHDGYRGKSTFLTASIADLGTIDFNKIISSIFVHSDVEVRLYEGKNFTGDSRSITQFVRDTKTIGKNDNIQSIAFVPPPFTVTKATYTFEVAERETCPKQVTITTEFETNQEGTVVYRRERQGGPPSEWVSVKSVKTGAKFIAKRSETQWVNEIDQVRRVKVKDSPVASAWENFKVDCPPFRVTDVSYAVRVAPGALCPRDISLLEVYIANGPGTFKRRRERQGGPPSEWIDTEVKADGNTYKAVFESKQKVGEIDQVRRVAARSRIGKFWEIESDWVPFKVDCLEILQSAIIYDGPDAGTCHYRTDVRLRVNADMQADLPYRLDCTDGQSASGTFAIKRTGPNTYIGVDTLKLDVTKTGKQICALKANLGAGLKNLTLQGKDFTCNDVLDADLYIDGPAQARCPAELKVRARFNARDSRDIPYGLTCNTGQTWSGTIPVAKTGPQTFIGVTVQPLKVTKSGKIACSLTSKLSGTNKVVALRGKDFQCVSVTVPPSVRDLTGGKPKPPTRTNVSNIACEGGVVRASKCYCPRGKSLKNGACTVNSAPLRSSVPQRVR